MALARVFLRPLDPKLLSQAKPLWKLLVVPSPMCMVVVKTVMWLLLEEGRFLGNL